MNARRWTDLEHDRYAEVLADSENAFSFALESTLSFISARWQKEYTLHLLIKTFLKILDFINKIFLTTFLNTFFPKKVRISNMQDFLNFLYKSYIICLSIVKPNKSASKKNYTTSSDNKMDTYNRKIGNINGQ